MGFLKDDPRLLTIRKNLKALIPANTMKYEEFKYCIENHIYIFIIRKGFYETSIIFNRMTPPIIKTNEIADGITCATKMCLKCYLE